MHLMVVRLRCIDCVVLQRVQPRSDAEMLLATRNIASTFVPPASVVRPKMVLDLSDMPTFLMSPVPHGGPVQCFITRQKGLFPRFDMFLEEGNVFLMCARMRKKSKSINCLVSMNQSDLARGSINYLGKIRAPLLSREFVAYDRGENPAHVDKHRASGLAARQEMACISFSDQDHSNAPRQVHVIIPAVRPDGSRLICRPFDASEGLAQRVRTAPGEVAALQNRAPTLDPETMTFRMDFGGRVTMPSVKNFQLVWSNDVGNSLAAVLLQFGRVGKDTFTLDFSFPISPYQAFAVAIAALHNKTA